MLIQLPYKITRKGKQYLKLPYFIIKKKETWQYFWCQNIQTNDKKHNLDSSEKFENPKPKKKLKSNNAFDTLTKPCGPVGDDPTYPWHVPHMWGTILEIFDVSPMVWGMFPDPLWCVPCLLGMIPGILDVSSYGVRDVPRPLWCLPCLLEMIPHILDMFPICGGLRTRRCRDTGLGRGGVWDDTKWLFGSTFFYIIWEQFGSVLRQFYLIFGCFLPHPMWKKLLSGQIGLGKPWFSWTWKYLCHMSILNQLSMPPNEVSNQWTLSQPLNRSQQSHCDRTKWGTATLLLGIFTLPVVWEVAITLSSMKWVWYIEKRQLGANQTGSPLPITPNGSQSGGR